MKKILIFGLFLVSSTLIAQPTVPPAPQTCNVNSCTRTIAGAPWDQCASNAASFLSNMSSNPVLATGTALQVGAVYRYTNVGTINTVPINVEVRVDAISNAILSSIDDNTGSATDETGASVVQNFSPRISPDVNLTSARRGYVQFTFRFFNAAIGNGFQTSVNLINPSMIQFDNDGNGNATSWFRETGMAAQVSTGNPAVLGVGTGNELSPYSYSDFNAATSSTTTWNGFAGSVCERTSISRCSEVAAAFNYNATVSSITIRLGYDHNGTNGGQPVRQYAIRFTCFGPQASPLPVRLTSFNASLTNTDKVNLFWTSAGEVDFSGYEIERSADGRHFQKVGSVASRGSQNSTANYVFADPISGLNVTTLHYRLKMNDQDGSFKYSHVVTIRTTGVANLVSISPNPASENVTLRFQANASGTGQLIVTDISGKVILQKTIFYNSGVNNISFPEASQLREGIYIIKGMVGNNSFNERLMIKR